MPGAQCTATAEHCAQGAPGEQAGHPFKRRALAQHHVVVQVHGAVGQPGPGVGDGVLAVLAPQQQADMAGTEAAQHVRFQRSQRHGAVGMRGRLLQGTAQQQLVTMAQGGMVKAFMALAGDDQQAAVRLFLIGQPGRQLVLVGRVQPRRQVSGLQYMALACLAEQGGAQVIDQLCGQWAGSGRAQADGVRHTRGQHRGAGGGTGQTAAEGAQDRLHQLRLQGTDLFEFAPAQAQQLTVPAGHDIGGAQRIGEEGNLAYRLAAADLGHQLLAVTQHIQPPAQHVVQAVGLLALTHQVLALAQVHQLHLGQQQGAVVLCQAGEQGHQGQRVVAAVAVHACGACQRVERCRAGARRVCRRICADPASAVRA